MSPDKLYPVPQQAEQYDILVDECVHHATLILEAFVEIDNRITNANRQLEVKK